MNLQKITGTFTRDYNICNLDKMIQQYLQNEPKDTVPKLKLEIEKLKMSISKPQTILERKSSIMQLKDLMNRVKELDTSGRYDKYVAETANLVERYKIIKPGIMVREFGKKLDDEDEKDEHFEERIKLIEQYLEIAKTYYPIDIYKSIKQTKGCSNPECNADDSQVEIGTNGVTFCIECGIERKIIVKSSVQKENNGDIITKSSGYDNRETFYKSCIKWQGKQIVELPSKLLLDLDVYFTTRNFPPGCEIREMPVLDDGRKYAKTSKEWMIKALTECGYSDLFEDWRYICKVYWGWELEDLSHLMDTIMDYYDMVQRALEEIPNRRRKKSQNVQFTLRGILMGLKVKCTNDDFRVIRTDGTLDDHERVWEIVCRKIGLPYIPI